MRPYLLVLVVTFLAGCATNIPAPIREAPAGDLSVAEARANIDGNIGRQVRWGGTIASVENRANETWVEVVARDLGSSGRPRAGDRSHGRFIARVQGFLDPSVYARDREITVSGTIESRVTRPIGQYSYTYPVVAADTTYLWQPVPERRDYYYYDPFWPYDPFWGPYPWYPWRYPYRYAPYPYFR